MKALRIGLAGLGVHGTRYARHLLAGDIPGAALGAVSRQDRTAGRAFADEHGVAFLDEPRDLATCPGIDAVVVCLPPALHGDLALACAESGRPALVEKPLAADGPAARRVQAAAERTGSLVMPGHTLRFDPLVRQMFDRRDEIGDLCGVTINQRFEPSPLPWIDTPGCGGMLLNTGIHEFDLLRYLTGREALAVTARTASVRTRNTEDQFVAAVELYGNVLAGIDASRASSARSGRIELIGTEGQLWGDHAHRTLEIVRGRQRRAVEGPPAVPTLPITLGAFVRSVRDDSPPPVTLRDGVAAVELVDAAARSAAEGRRINLGAD